MEAEQSSYYREYPVAFGQKREIVGVGQSDTANNTLCRYCFQGASVFGQKAPGAPVFGHCPILIFPVQLTTSRIGNLTRLIHTLAICVTIQASSRLNLLTSLAPQNVYLERSIHTIITYSSQLGYTLSAFGREHQASRYR